MVGECRFTHLRSRTGPELKLPEHTSAATDDHHAWAAAAVVAGVPITVLVVVAADPNGRAAARRRWRRVGLDVTASQREERGKSEHVWQNGRDFS
jgi:hypothetical protein